MLCWPAAQQMPQPAWPSNVTPFSSASHLPQSELEDLCFAVLQPSEYRKLRRELDELWGVPTIPQQVQLLCCSAVLRLGLWQQELSWSSCGGCPPSRSRCAHNVLLSLSMQCKSVCLAL